MLPLRIIKINNSAQKKKQITETQQERETQRIEQQQQQQLVSVIQPAEFVKLSILDFPSNRGELSIQCSIDTCLI